MMDIYTVVQQNSIQLLQKYSHRSVEKLYLKSELQVTVLKCLIKFDCAMSTKL